MLMKPIQPTVQTNESQFYLVYQKIGKQQPNRKLWQCYSTLSPEFKNTVWGFFLKPHDFQEPTKQYLVIPERFYFYFVTGLILGESRIIP